MMIQSRLIKNIGRVYLSIYLECTLILISIIMSTVTNSKKHQQGDNSLA
jgi:hypothetical protein